MHRTVGDYEVRGVNVDSTTRCAHYDSDRDVIALRFGCCEVFYPCHLCHEIVTDHESQPWPSDRFDEPAVLCGVCETALTVSTYLDADHECPSCHASFNSGCRAHYGRYFEGL